MHDTDYLNKYRIIVYSKEMLFSKIYDHGTGPIIYILHHNNHFDLLTKPPTKFFAGFYCSKCNKPYSNRFSHVNCGERCKCCYTMNNCLPTEWQKCRNCNRSFKNKTCFTLHLKKQRGKSVCEIKCKCNCGTAHNRGTVHNCHQSKCNNCGENYTKKDTHFCFMQQYKNFAKVKGLIFFDSEATQTFEIKKTNFGSVYQHTVNLICAKKICLQCIQKYDAKCAHCINIQFSNLNEFCFWLFTDKHKQYTVFCHNLTYDGTFIMRFIFDQGHKPKVLMRGLKIICMEFMNIKFLDSYNFLTMPLSKLPQTMGFQAKKGHFPHLFNRPENYNKVFPTLPDMKYYGPDEMKTPERDTFLTWYNENKNTEFDFNKNLVSYCELDVNILSTACMMFRELIMEKFNIDCFAVSCTIASLTMVLFRSMFLTKKSIAILPHNGYVGNENQSKIAISWMRWISESTNINISHCRNGHEIRIGPYKVDGQNREDKKHVFELFGCFFHSHICQVKRTPALDLVYSKTLSRIAYFEEHGYKLTYIWECSLNAQLKANSAMRAFFNNNQVRTPLNPRDSFFGGRTNVRKLYHLTQNKEKNFYIDICSLYPYIMKRGQFPIGHPIIITENFSDINNREYKGLISCKVLAPKSLFHPVLPKKLHNKLMFFLCYTCALNFLKSCNHTDEERSFNGVWCSPELYKAIDMGYRVLELFEVYHYEEWSNELFKKYVNSFLKLKQEASGFPANVTSEAEKAAYISDYESHEGIKLDKIEKNPGLRSVSKICLNSLYGKFAQRNTLSKTEYFTEVQAFYNVVFAEENEVQQIHIISDSLVGVTYRKKDAYVIESKNSNCIIASFVTSQARLLLYTYLNKLHDSVYYTDTDCLVYLAKDGKELIETRNYLGDMTNELQVNEFITEWISAGPKQYGYKTNFGNICIKIRGFTLSHQNALRLTFEKLRSMVIEYVNRDKKHTVDLIRSQIKVNQDRFVHTQPLNKKYSIVYNKCIVQKDYTTVPFGYR